MLENEKPAAPNVTAPQEKPKPFLDVMRLWPGEDAKAFEKLRDGIVRALRPRGTVQEKLTEEIAALHWRRDHLNIFDKAVEAHRVWGSYFNQPTREMGILSAKSAYARHTAKVVKIMMTKKVRRMNSRAQKVQRDVEELIKKTFEDADGPTALELAKGLEKYWADWHEKANAIELAADAKSLTPENYLLTLDFRARLDAEIDRRIDRLHELQRYDERSSSGPTKILSIGRAVRAAK